MCGAFFAFVFADTVEAFFPGLQPLTQIRKAIDAWWQIHHTFLFTVTVILVPNFLCIHVFLFCNNLSLFRTKRS